jgi:hypothetical protein
MLLHLETAASPKAPLKPSDGVENHLCGRKAIGGIGEIG